MRRRLAGISFLSKSSTAGLPVKEGNTVHAPIEINLANGLTNTSAIIRSG